MGEEQYELRCGSINLIHFHSNTFFHSDFLFLAYIGAEFGLLMELVTPCFKLCTFTQEWMLLDLINQFS